MLPNEDYGIYGKRLAEDIARYFRQLKRVGLGHLNIQPPTFLPFKAASSDIRQGHIIQFDDLVEAFEARTTDKEIAYFKNYAVQEGSHPLNDSDLTNLRRNTYGVSISDVTNENEAEDYGIAIVNGPACVEAVLGTATATNVGNFIVPWTTKVNAGKVEVRPYGIARCTEQEPERTGWMWVMMGDAKWNFIGKTTATHSKGGTVNVNVHFGTNKGSETATGLTQSCYNRFADLTTGLWVRGSSEYLGWELTVGECV